MSVEAITWAIDQKPMPTGAKLLLLVIANSADHAGIAFPGRQLLSARCCCSPRTITTNLAYLEECGWIARFERRRANGSRTSDWIVLAPEGARGSMLDADGAQQADYPEQVAAVAVDLGSPEADTSGEDSSPEDRR